MAQICDKKVCWFNRSDQSYEIYFIEYI